MKGALAAIVVCGAAVALYVKSDRPEAAPSPRAVIAHAADSKDGPRLAIDLDTAGSKDGGGEGGSLSLRLPGGLEGKIDLPAGLADEARFDLDGVGRYPGARLDRVTVTGGRQAGAGSTRADGVRIELGFAAPAPAATVASWYQEKLAATGRAVARDGQTLTTTTKDGDRMELRFAEAGAGRSRGQVLIFDRD